MEDAKPQSDTKQPLLQRVWTTDWDRLIKVATAVGAILFVVGLIVENLYYSRFPVSDFTVFRPACILTGAWTVGLLIVVEFPAVAAWQVFLKSELRGRRLATDIVAVALFSLVASIGLGATSLDLLGATSLDLLRSIGPHGATSVDRWQRVRRDFLSPDSLFRQWISLVMTCNVLNLALTAFKWFESRKPNPSESRAPTFLLPMLAYAGGLFFTVMYSGTAFYPAVGLHAGGGEPQSGTLYFSTEGAQLYQSLRRQVGWYHDNDGKDDFYPNGALSAVLIKTESDRYIVDSDYCSIGGQAHADRKSTRLNSSHLG